MKPFRTVTTKFQQVSNQLVMNSNMIGLSNKIKTTIFLLLTIFTISGCNNQPIITQITTETQCRDTTIYVDVPLYVDTTIYVLIPGFKDSARIPDSVRVKNGLAYIKTVHKKAGIIGVYVSLYKSNLFIKKYLPKFYRITLWVFLTELILLFLFIMNKLGIFGIFTNIIKKGFPFSK